MTTDAVSIPPMLALTGSRVDALRNALAVLKNRRLPTPDAEGLVVALWHRLKPAFDEYDDRVKAIQTEGDAVVKMDDTPEKAEKLAALQVRLDAAQAATYDIRAPRKKLTVAHLPKAYKDLEGNAMAVAGLRIQLTPEFFDEPVDDDIPSE